MTRTLKSHNSVLYAEKPQLCKIYFLSFYADNVHLHPDETFCCKECVRKIQKEHTKNCDK